MVAGGILTRRVSLRVTILWTLMLIVVLSIFSVSSRAETTDLVTAPVDPANRVVLQGQRAPWALPQSSQGPVPSDTMLEHLTLVLKRSPQQQKAFEQFLQQLQEPGSPNYHRWLTPVQVGKRFGASEHDIDAVSEWLRSEGLRVNSVANSRMMIDFSGTASMVGAAFATEMRYYLVGGEQRMASADDPKIPAALAGVIQSVSGLNSVNDHPYHGAKQAQVIGSDLPALSVCNGGSCSYFVTPGDFNGIYDLDGLLSNGVDGRGQTIAIIGRSRVYDPDIENFESLTGFAVQDPTVIVPPNGLDPGQPAGTGGTASSDQLEATLDVQRATGTAPGATIDLVISADDNGTSGLRIAAEYVIDTSPVFAQIMNISFGACEADRTLSDVQFWDTVFSQGAAEGISSFVASGDAGVAGCDTYFQTPPQTQIASPNYICSSSYSTCVGGTEFADASDPSTYWNPTNFQWLTSALGYIPEGGWNEPLNGDGETQAASSGGGYSSYIPTPSWQTGTGVPGAQGRYTPDVAFSSSAHDGYFGCLAASGGTHPGDCVVQGNGTFYFEYFFGTSAAAPGMAGITALLNQSFWSPQGELNQRLYQLAANPAYAIFHDVTVATSAVTGCMVTTPSMCNNSTPLPTGLTGGLSGYLVTDGFDEVTGLGSIDGANLAANWFAGFPTTATVVTSSLNPAQLGQAVTFTAAVTPSGAHEPTGSITFVDYDEAMGTVALTTVDGSQVATLTPPTLGFGTYQIRAFYSGDANNAASTSPILNQNIIAPTFGWAATGSTTATILSGQTAAYNFTANPTGTGVTTFGANVVFSCSGLPDATTTCNFTPAQIAAGSGRTPVQLTITTNGPNAPAGDDRHRRADHRSPWLPLTLPLAGVVMVGIAGRKMSKYSAMVFLGFCVALALLCFSIACGSGGSGSNNPPPVMVTVNPGSPASVFPNDAADNWPAQTAQFTATVANTNNTVVTWAVTTPNGGSISANGLYMAPNVAAGLPTSVTITATSQADPTKSGSGQETITRATIPATYSNIMVAATESTTVNSVPVTLVVQ
jgi:pseudomonalisin